MPARSRPSRMPAVRASQVLAGPAGQVPGRPRGVHRAGPPGLVRLEDLQLRPGLRADAAPRRRAQVAAGVRLDRPVVARRLHHPGRVPGADQGGLRRRPGVGKPALGPLFHQAVAKAQPAWRNVVATAVRLGIPTPAFSTALAYYDGYRSARLPANLLQAQRDYFGATRTNRVDREGVFHTDWLRLRKPPLRSRRNSFCTVSIHGTQSMSAEYLEEMFGLDGQTAVVIGGAGVLGGALCRGLCRPGPTSSWPI